MVETCTSDRRFLDTKRIPGVTFSKWSPRGKRRSCRAATSTAVRCVWYTSARELVQIQTAFNNHQFVLELGAAAEREISERASHLGPAVGIEVEPIENWLEIELGATTYKARGATDWELELPFKKPFRLTSSVEMMPGL